jgi:hypothetical protein
MIPTKYGMYNNKQYTLLLSLILQARKKGAPKERKKSSEEFRGISTPPLQEQSSPVRSTQWR